MRRAIALFLAMLLMFSMVACAGQTPEPDEQEETPAIVEETTADPEPDQGPDAYANPCDHPHEGMDLTVFDGIYRANLPQNEDDETWLEITGCNDFIMLEYHGLMEGSVYRYYAEEFWPGEGWYTSENERSVSGKSQTFSNMGLGDCYDTLPQNRCITLTEDGVVLNYDDSDAEYYVRDDGFEGGHTDAETLKGYLGEAVTLEHGGGEKVLGTWGYWSGWEAACMGFEKDGTFSMFRKIPGSPIAAYRGAYGFDAETGDISIMAERLGYGRMPYMISWQWQINESGELVVTDDGSVFYEGQTAFWPVEEAFFSVLDADTALGYLTEQLHDDGDYTDQYGTEYTYYYSLPAFLRSEHPDLNAINEKILGKFEPIIQEERGAMEMEEFLSFDRVDWQAGVYRGVLFLHVYAYAFDWEEHAAFYVDTETYEQLTAKEVLKRLEISEDAFLDAARTGAEEIFISTFEDMAEEDKETYGYYDCLEQTLSDEFINLELPIFADRDGEITVWLKISSMAGSGLMWEASRIFEEHYGED